MDIRPPLKTWLTPGRLALLYVLVSAVWVVVSSELVLIELRHPAAITAWEVGKGLAFITASGGLIYWITRRLVDRLLGSERALRESEEQRNRLEKRLMQAQKMEGIGRLAGGVAHDFNNILNAIAVSTKLLQDKLLQDELLQDELLQKKTGDDPAQSWLQNIRSAVERGSLLTRQLLTFGRLEMVSLKPVNLNRAVTEVAGILRPVFREKAALQLKLEPHLWPVMADDSQMTQILLNLCLNAHDAIQEGGTVEILTQNVIVGAPLVLRLPEITPGANVLLTVRDTGTGIQPELLDHIFEPFFTTKGEDKGRGLGLSTVYGVLKHMGGSIDVESEIGKGTVFHLYLPKTSGHETMDTPVAGEAKNSIPQIPDIPPQTESGV